MKGELFRELFVRFTVEVLDVVDFKGFDQDGDGSVAEIVGFPEKGTLVLGELGSGFVVGEVGRDFSVQGLELGAGMAEFLGLVIIGEGLKAAVAG